MILSRLRKPLTEKVWGDFLKIAIIPNTDKDSGLNVSREAAEFLLENGCTVCSCQEGVHPSVQVLSVEESVKKSDIVITVGGDGTILHTARIAAVHRKPILGINLGRVGFMAEVEPHELYLLKALTEGAFVTEKRMMLSCEVLRDGASVFSTFSLNDAAIAKGSVARMIEFDVFSDDETIHSYRADGIVFASPTGSTAYSLSAGGPVVDPKINCIVATPVCVHSFFAARSVIFSENSSLNIKMNTSEDTPAFLTADGIDNFSLRNGDIVNIRRSEHDLDLIRLKKGSFYSVLSKKIK